MKESARQTTGNLREKQPTTQRRTEIMVNPTRRDNGKLRRGKAVSIDPNPESPRNNRMPAKDEKET